MTSLRLPFPILLPTAIFLLTTSFLACQKSDDKGDDDDNGKGGKAGSGASGNGSSGNGSSGNGSSGNGASGNGASGNGSSGNGSSGGAGNGGGALVSCSTGAIFAGNPKNENVDARPPEGTGLLEDPPFPYRSIVFSKGQMITHQGQEIWRADLADGKLHKIAGKEGQQAFITGPCAGARFANLHGLALASDGSIFASDQTANAIMKITDPLGPNCAVSHWAGTPTDVPEGDLSPGNPPNIGNVDGPGDAAKFGLPERLAIDANDNLYVWDNGNNSIRKIANDAAHTVSTFADNIGGSGGGALMYQVFLGDKLYVWGKSGNDVFLAAIDGAGNRNNLLSGRADIFGGGSSDSQTLGGLVTDGEALILFFNGQIFRVTTDGKVSPPLAGVYSPGLSYSPTYDPAVSHPAAELEVPASPGGIATGGAESHLAIDPAHDLYISTRETGYYVLKLDCSP